MSEAVSNEGTSCKVRAGWLDLRIHAYVKALIIGALFVYLFHVEVYQIVHRWFTDFSNWGHGVLIPLFSLYLLNQRKKEIVNLPARANYLGLFFLICCIAAYPFIIFQLKIGYARSLIMIPALGAVVLFLGGWQLVKYTWLPILYLFFAIPMPDRLYRELTIPMRMLAAEVSAVLLNLIPTVETTVNGVIIDVLLNGKPVEPSLDVAEACSGMRLLMAFFALGVAMAYLHYRPIWQRITLLASTIPIAILCNIVRVTVTGFIHIFIGPEYAQGIYHDMLGLSMLLVAFVFYWALAWFMSALFSEQKEAPAENIVFRRTR